MTFLDLVRKVGELGRAKCYPDCDIVVHRREAAMYMGVLRENPELLRELTATPSSGVTEGKAENGDEPVTAGLLRGMAADLDRAAFATRSAGMQAIKVVAADLRSLADLVPNPQPSAPADDTARVLAGLREEMDVLIGEYSHDGSWRLARGVERARDMVEAAQQRLADRGRGGGSDG